MHRHLLILFLIATSFVIAQQNTNSPYSSLGLGDVNFYGDAFSNSLGGVSTTIQDSSEANFFNPSSYAGIAKQLPLFSFGLNHYEKKWADAGYSSSGRFTGFTHLGIAIPFAKRFGIAAGLKPYSRVGYQINDAEKVDGDSIHYVYEGKGGVNEVFIGFAANILNSRTHVLSLGANGKYYFGAVNHLRRAYINTNQGETGGEDNTRKNAAGFGVEIGLNYEFKISGSSSLILGGVYQPGLNVKFAKRDSRIYFGDYMQQTTYDTILNQQKTMGSIYIPSSTKIGLAYRLTPQEDSTRKSVKLPSYFFTFEYEMSDWSSYREYFGGQGIADNFVNSTAYRFGFEFIPHRMSASRTSSYIKFYDKIKYRIGAYWVNTPYEINQEQIQDRGVTIGLGFPFILHRAVSTVSISGSYGVTGKNSKGGSLNEKYYGVFIGINIAPGYDRWFRKYKYD